MNKDIARRWVEELESGKWEVCHGQLGEGERSRCCLGVLQEMAPEVMPKNPLDSIAPTIPIWEWSRLSRDDGRNLMRLNDKTHSGYGKVVAYIRKNFL